MKHLIQRHYFRMQSQSAALAACLCLFTATPLVAGDGFADDLTIPDGIEISDPIRYSEAITPLAQDDFKRRILQTVRKEDSGKATVVATLPNLSLAFASQRDRLERFLASSPAWRVFEVRGNRFATRRWKIGNDWRYEMHGYYSAFDLNSTPGQAEPLPDFQTRCTLGLSNQPWVRHVRDATQILAGDTVEIESTERFGQQNSLSLISAGTLLVEIFEQTRKTDRSLTNTTIELLDEEAAKILTVNDWDTLTQSLPEGSIRTGKPVFQLCSTGGPGNYDSVAWVNPGEAGTTFVKAFEVTRGDELSATRLRQYGNERIGWSDDPNELFFTNTHFTIHEGDWNQFYAARFELWFEPDSGEPARKLLERNFRIEGWMR